MSARPYPTQDDILNDIVDISIFDHRIIVAGSRGFDNYKAFCEVMHEIISKINGSFIFLSGMASSGADKLIVDFCNEFNYLYYPYPANWDKFGKRAGYLRNGIMADRGTWLIAFYDGKSPGTTNMIQLAREKELHLNIINTELLTTPQVEQTKTYTLFTIQMAKWRLAQAIGVKFLDITAKSGIQAFAPDYKAVIAYKEGKLSEEEYTIRYKEKMYLSREEHKKFWKQLLKYPQIAFACYCPAGEFCHRHLFVEMVKDYLEQQDIVVKLGGEITDQMVENEIQKIIPVNKENSVIKNLTKE